MDDKNNSHSKAHSGRAVGGKDDPMSKPQWADSLRNLYDSVVDEPIPDSFKDLLAQLGEPKNDDAAGGGAA